MNCKNCGKEIDNGLELCVECQTATAKKEDNAINETVDTTSERIDTPKEVWAKLTAKNTSAKDKNIYFLNLLKALAKKIIGNYKNFKNLNIKQKILHIAIPVLIILVLFGSGGGGKEDVAIQCAINQVDSQIFGGADVEIYDAVCVDKDGKGRFIVTVTSERNRFETWWAVLVTLYPDGEHYNAIANYHGGGISQDEWVEEYKTDSDYGWGTKIED